MKHLKTFDEHILESHVKNEDFMDAIDKQMIPVPPLGIYISRNPIGPQQGLEAVQNFLKLISHNDSPGSVWRLPTSEEIMYVYKHQNDLDLLTIYKGDREKNMKSHEYWTSSYDGDVYDYFSFGEIKQTTNPHWLYQSLIVKEFDDADKKKYSGAITGHQYGV